MNIQFLFIWLSASILLASSCQALVETEEEIRAAMIDWEKTILETPSSFDPNSIRTLGEGLRKLSRSNSTFLESRRKLYLAAQEKALSIPGHARYFADQVVSSRKESEDFSTDLEYYRACDALLKTLPHLPSPETVWVLGEMLESDADMPTREEIIEALRRADHGGHLWHCPSGMAMFAFSELEIRNRPFGSGPNGTYISEKDLVGLRAWWEKIKSGENTFSFKGQSVEYRFKPDGTWGTIPIVNPPDDGPKPAPEKTTDRPKKQSAPAQSDDTDASRDPAWWWFGIGGVVLLTAGAWFWRNSQSG